MRILSLDKNNTINFKAYKMSDKSFKLFSNDVILYPLKEICETTPDNLKDRFYVENHPHCQLRQWLNTENIRKLNKYDDIYLTFHDVWNTIDSQNKGEFLENITKRAKEIYPNSIEDVKNFFKWCPFFGKYI